ncbi:hypothetical protein LFL97_23460 [Burkholderia sp. JSH-S8]|nr:hypothetical protein LFL97_23460 [Burkholderia sp. JSH-S8]
MLTLEVGDATGMDSTRAEGGCTLPKFHVQQTVCKTSAQNAGSARLKIILQTGEQADFKNFENSGSSFKLDGETMENLRRPDLIV